MKRLGCLMLVGWTASVLGAPPDPPGEWKDRFPVELPSDQARVYEAFNLAPHASVTTLVDSLVRTQVEDRVAAEYALDGWTTFSLRPGAVDGEQATLASALAAAATGSEPHTVRAFLIQQLGKVGTRESVEPLSRMLSDPEWAQEASLALQAFAVPAYSDRVREAAESALVGASGRHREVLLHLGGKAQARDTVSWWQVDRVAADPALRERSLQVSREQMAAHQPGDPGHRVCTALGVLADLLGDDAFPDLAEALDHPSPSVRATARERMAACGSDRVSPWLLSRLDSDDPDVRAEALVLMTRRKDPAALSRAHAMLADESEDVRRAAYDACAALGEADVVDTLLGVYVTAGVSDRSALLAVLIPRRGPGIADRAHAGLVASDDPRVREAMLEVIGACMARDYVDEAVAAIRADDEDLANQAVKTAERLATREQAETLIDLLRDDDLAPSLRSSLVPALVASLNDADEEGDRVDPVKAILSETEGPARQNLHRVLGGLQAGEAVVVLKEETSHPDAAIRDSAVRALCVWNGFEAVDPLLDVARSTTNETHNALALRRLVQLVQQHVPADTEDVELREDARRRYEEALAVASRDEERAMIREAVAGLFPEPESPENEAAP